jgi:hypothetical protein
MQESGKVASFRLRSTSAIQTSIPLQRLFRFHCRDRRHRSTSYHRRRTTRCDHEIPVDERSRWTPKHRYLLAQVQARGQEPVGHAQQVSSSSSSSSWILIFLFRSLAGSNYRSCLGVVTTPEILSQLQLLSCLRNADSKNLQAKRNASSSQVVRLVTSAEGISTSTHHLKHLTHAS